MMAAGAIRGRSPPPPLQQNLLDHVDECFEGLAFVHHCGNQRTQLLRAEERAHIAGHHDHAGCVPGFLQGLQQVEAGAIPQVEVENHQLGVLLFQHALGRGQAGGQTDDLEAEVGVEQIGQNLGKHQVVIGNQAALDGTWLGFECQAAMGESMDPHLAQYPI